jgi:hypothetical protein
VWIIRSSSSRLRPSSSSSRQVSLNSCAASSLASVTMGWDVVAPPAGGRYHLVRKMLFPGTQAILRACARNRLRVTPQFCRVSRNYLDLSVCALTCDVMTLKEIRRLGLLCR